MKDEALRLALEALGHFEKAGLATLKTIDAITAIKQALEQPEPEPVDWEAIASDQALTIAMLKVQLEGLQGAEQLPWNKRKPLTDEEVRECSQAMDAEPLAEGWTELIKFARAVEAAHGIFANAQNKGEA